MLKADVDFSEKTDFCSADNKFSTYVYSQYSYYSNSFSVQAVLIQHSFQQYVNLRVETELIFYSFNKQKHLQ